ncbi:barstar family protein [Williamsia sp. MIQD14]|uniref:barstar family protein n=1 Tax=Williamsia sp. MIQD14 TaxID=3425703 RepID=UPI003DA15439
MTDAPARPSDPVRYEIDGDAISSPEDFYTEIGRAVNGPGGYFGANLDALADCLRGGFGTPDDRPFEFEWHHSDVARAQLSTQVRGDRSVFDHIIEVFADCGVPLRLR